MWRRNEATLKQPSPQVLVRVFSRRTGPCIPMPQGRARWPQHGSGTIDVGTAAGSKGGPPNFAWIRENALHARLTLTCALITGLAALRRADRASEKAYQQRLGLIDPRNESAAGKDSGAGGIAARIERTLERLSPQQPARSLAARVWRTLALLVLATAGLVLYEVTAGVAERLMAERRLNGNGMQDGAEQNRREAGGGRG
jgi:hypothetical protein